MELKCRNTRTMTFASCAGGYNSLKCTFESWGTHFMHMRDVYNNINNLKTKAVERTFEYIVTKLTGTILFFVKKCCTKNGFPIMDFFRKCDQICSFLRIWLNLLKKSLIEEFIFCAVKLLKSYFQLEILNIWKLQSNLIWI